MKPHNLQQFTSVQRNALLEQQKLDYRLRRAHMGLNGATGVSYYNFFLTTLFASLVSKKDLEIFNPLEHCAGFYHCVHEPKTVKDL